MDRITLDAFCTRHRLATPAIATALALTGNRPEPAAWRTFFARMLHAAGLGALGAGVIFFVAANWQAWGLLGRFALLQAALMLSVGAALWRAPPHRVGQSALLLATLLVGGLLALFGQTYQTGADVHELFFTWALLALPFALAGSTGALWALWWVVLNVGLALLCGWLGRGHVFWRLIDGLHIGHAELLMIPCIVNLAGAGVFLHLHSARRASAAPLWLVRLLTALGIGFGTMAVLVALGDVFAHFRSPNPLSHAAMFLTFAAICTAIGVATWRGRRDVFPMALLAASAITISSTWLAKVLDFGELGTLFLLASWLIGSSTASGMLLMHWSRTWPGEPAATPIGGHP